MDMTFEQKQAYHLAQLDWLAKKRPNYELRLYNIHNFISLEYRITSKQDFDNLTDYAKFVMNRGPELLKSIIHNTTLEQETEDGVIYHNTWGPNPVWIDADDLETDDLTFSTWFINNIETGEQTASGDQQQVDYNDVSDPFVGKYAMMNSIKETA